MSASQPLTSSTAEALGINSKPTPLGIGLRLIFPVFMVITGLATVSSCPKQVGIPVYLIVGGLLFMVSIATNAILAYTFIEQDVPPMLKYMDLAVDGFNCIWFIIGSVWTYQAYKPNYDDDKLETYCNEFLYVISFAYFTIIYIITGFGLIAIIYKMIFPSNVN